MTYANRDDLVDCMQIKHVNQDLSGMLIAKKWKTK